MPRPPSDAVQIAIRVPQDWLAKADHLAKLISRPGFEASRTDAFRAAIARGFDELLKELGRPTNEDEFREAMWQRIDRFQRAHVAPMSHDALVEWSDAIGFRDAARLFAPTIERLVKDGRIARKGDGYAISRRLKR